MRDEGIPRSAEESRKRNIRKKNKLQAASAAGRDFRGTAHFA
jgi:hypothetical protein